MEHHHKILHLITGLSLLGFLVSLYLVYVHYQPDYLNSLLPCDINSVFSCSSVNQSTYALFFGVPVAIIGAFGYISLVALSMFHFTYHKPLLVISSSLGFLFALYLTLVEAFVLNAYCLYCLASFGIITLITILALKTFGKETINFFRTIEFED